MSGICAAILLSRTGYNVTIYERQERIGKKILLTGNGRCNISNQDIDASWYVSSDDKKLARILNNLSLKERDAFYDSIGLCITDIRGGLYPVSRQASSVIDALRFTLSEANVKIVTGAKAVALHKDLSIEFEDKSVPADKGAAAVIIACGGKAGVYSEEKENGIRLIKDMGHRISDTYPALTYLRCEEDLRSVAGVRCDAALTLNTAKGSFSERGELQINKDALSGIPVFQLSRYAKDLSGCSLEADFLCFMNDALPKYKARAASYPDRSLEDFFAGWLNKKLAQYLIKRAGMRPSDTVRKSSMQRLYETLRHCSFKPAGRGSFREAQLMCGGIPLNEVDDDLQSLLYKNVYATGEILDVNGACGGYNLHFALCSAYTVSNAIINKGAGS